jgi:site-specific recombinase XerD
MLRNETKSNLILALFEFSGCSFAEASNQRRLTRDDDWIFPSRNNRGGHLTTRQYGRLLDDWVAMIGLDPGNYGTHSMRRTKVALIYKKTGNLRACQLLLGHSKLESTVRYLGVDIEDAISLSEDVEI